MIRTGIAIWCLLVGFAQASTLWSSVWVTHDPLLKQGHDERLLLKQTWEAECDWTPDRSYYIDPVGGSDAANGITTSTPVQTFAQAQTLIAAYFVTNPSHKVALHVLRGTTCRELPTKSVGPYGALCLQYHQDKTFQIRTYGNPWLANPRLTVFKDLSSLSWSNVSGTIWQATGVDAVVGANGVSWIRSQKDTLDETIWAYRATTGDVDAATVPSFTYTTASSGTLRINVTTLGDPAFLQLEANENNRNYEGFASDGDLAGVNCPDGIDLHGYGCNRATPHNNQLYHVKLAQFGNRLGICRGARMIYGSDHIVGQNCGVAYNVPSGNSQADGQALITGCYVGASLGSTTGGGGTAIPVIAYAPNGGHAFFLFDCIGGAGQLPQGSSLSSGGTYVYAHSNSTNKYAAMVASGLTFLDRPNYRFISAGLWDGVAMPGTTFADAKSILEDVKLEGTKYNAMLGLAQSRMSYINCEMQWYTTATAGPIYVEQSIIPAAQYINCTINVDIRTMTSGFFAVLNHPTQYTNFSWRFINCHIHCTENLGSGSARWDYWGANADNGGGLLLNTIFTATSGFAIGMSEANVRHCAFRGMGSWVYDTAVNPVLLSAYVPFGTVAKPGDQLWMAGTPTGAPDFDDRWQPRGGMIAIGPRQEPAYTVPIGDLNELLRARLIGSETDTESAYDKLRRALMSTN